MHQQHNKDSFQKQNKTKEDSLLITECNSVHDLSHDILGFLKHLDAFAQALTFLCNYRRMCKAMLSTSLIWTTFHFVVQCISVSSGYSSKSPVTIIFLKEFLEEFRIRTNTVKASAIDVRVGGSLFKSA
nr:hypothetical protein Iba_chr07eCG8450 [Ipomoea batatas]